MVKSRIKSSVPSLPQLLLQQRRRLYRPFVIISAAMSIDGKIATKTGDSKLSSKQDLTRLHHLRSTVDAILIGSNTLRQDDPQLTVRYVKNNKKQNNPTRVIINPRGDISPHSKILKTAKSIPTIIVVSKSAVSKINLQLLEKSSAQIIVLGSPPPNNNYRSNSSISINTKLLLHKLYAQNIKTLLVEGGSIVNGDFIKNGLYDKLIITVSPRIIGSNANKSAEGSIPLVRGVEFNKIKDSHKLYLHKVRCTASDEIVLYYSKKKKKKKK